MQKAINKSSKLASAVKTKKPVAGGSSATPLAGNVIPFDKKKTRSISALCNPDMPVTDELYQIMAVLEDRRTDAKACLQELEKTQWDNDDRMEVVANEKIEWAEQKARLSSAEFADYVLAVYGPKSTVEDVNDVLNSAWEILTSQGLLIEQLSVNSSSMIEMADTLLTLCALKIAMEAAND